MGYSRGMIYSPMDMRPAHTASVDQHLLWPVFRVLAEHTEQTRYGPLVEQVRSFLGSSRLYEEEAFSPDRLKNAMSVEMVVREVHHLWCELRQLEPEDLLRRRRLIAVRIVASGLSEHDQAGLITALDYLCRLSMARRVSVRAWGPPTVEIPVTRNVKMQLAYQRVAELASADLPMWLLGEKGTELQDLARLGHRLKGMEDRNFLMFQGTGAQSESIQAAVDNLDAMAAACPGGTLFLDDLDRAPIQVQKWAYDRLLRDLSAGGAVWIVVTSAPREGSYEGLPAELFAFLGPFRVEVPPLRSRTEDLADIISYLAMSRNLSDPAHRLHPEVLKLFRQHHWPGNVAELERAVVYLVKTRPAGEIKLGDVKALLNLDEPPPRRGSWKGSGKSGTKAAFGSCMKSRAVEWSRSSC